MPEEPRTPSEGKRVVRTGSSDKLLFAAVLGLVLFGLVMVHSASAVIAAERFGSPYFFVARQATAAVFGLIGMIIAMQIDYRFYNRPVVIYSALLVCAGLLVVVFGFPAVNGAHRWIRFGGQQFQPSEVAKLAVVIFLAHWLERNSSDPSRLRAVLLPCALVTSAFAALIAAEPDLGTALVLFAALIVMLFAAGVPFKQVVSLPALASVPVACLLILVPFRMKRLVAFLDPWADPQGSGYHVIQSLLAIGSGGLWGLGLSQGRQKLFYLPEPHTDFIFAVVAEELGLFGAAALVGVFVLLGWRGLRAAGRAPDEFGTLLATGLTVMVVVQALFNMSVALALVPTKGIPLPLVSYGGTSLCISMAAMGVLLNISQGK